jgi:hypothetical protein
MFAYILLMVTLEPATQRVMCAPACEMYRTPEQTQARVLEREYTKGIPTWTKIQRVHPSRVDTIEPRAAWF